MLLNWNQIELAQVSAPVNLLKPLTSKSYEVPYQSQRRKSNPVPTDQDWDIMRSFDIDPMRPRKNNPSRIKNRNTTSY